MYFLHSSWICDFSSSDFLVSLNVAEETKTLCSEKLYFGIVGSWELFDSWFG